MTQFPVKTFIKYCSVGAEEDVKTVARIGERSFPLNRPFNRSNKMPQYETQEGGNTGGKKEGGQKHTQSPPSSDKIYDNKPTINYFTDNNSKDINNNKCLFLHGECGASREPLCMAAKLPTAAQLDTSY